MARNYVFAPGEYYHLYSRGFEKLPVFRKGSDYQRFAECLYLLNNSESVNIRDIKQNFSRGLTSGTLDVYSTKRKETLVDIGAYCLMPNHFHILVREKDEKGISRFMQKLMTSYTMYFNKKYDRTGSIFGSSFKARHVTSDNHLKYLFAYIHLNPKERGDITNKLKEYAYSSYADYLGIYRSQATTLNQTVFPDYFMGAMEQEINEWASWESPQL